jgi:hypothetical protein
MIRFGIPPTDPGAIADKLAPLNWFAMIIGVVFAGLLYRASSMARILGPVFLLIIAWNNWLVASLDVDQESDFVYVGTFLVFLATSVLFLPEIRRVMSNPGLRWWLTPVRKRVKIAARVRPAQGGAELLAHTFDLSEEGVFIRVDNWGAASTRALSVGTHCAVALDLEPNRPINGIARVVRHANAIGKYPSGFAVYFEGLEYGDRARLRKFVRSLPSGTS